MIEYLSSDDIRVFHEVALERYGGAVGEHEPGQIEFMAEKPAFMVFGEELYPGLFMKAAVYMYGFATRQYFVDGNKRTAYLAAAAFLELNGYSVIVDDTELYTISLAIANHQIAEIELAVWLEQHSTKQQYGVKPN